MKTYEGERSLSGALVTVDGAPLPPRLDLHSFNRSGSVSDRTISPPIGAAKPSWRQRLLLRING